MTTIDGLAFARMLAEGAGWMTILIGISLGFWGLLKWAEDEFCDAIDSWQSRARRLDGNHGKRL